MAYVMREIGSVQVWDSFVKEHSPMALFQSWAWGEVEKKTGNTIWRWGWYDGKRLMGVAQIEKISARLGTFLHVRHGPIGKINYEDLKKLAKTERAWFIRVSPQVPPQEEKQYKKLGFVPAPIHAMDAELCWVLDLNKSEEDLLAGMRKTTRYETRRAQKLGVTVDTGFKDFLALYARTSERHGFVPHRGIQEELEVFGNNAIVYNAAHEGKTIASAIILFWGDEAIYHHGASIPSKVPASYLVQWEAIREAKNRGKKIYNFWGIAPDDRINHPWRGITLFKTGFGGRQMEFMHAQDYPVSPLYILPKTIELIRKRLKGY
ncbi:MAG: peptidoglycan bridge formation glycyltransferase FemA/FemB family protein [Candidatus Gottesmanbacteria bacterium]|nr:peptidoglycan bridge formation glycyltransferase FemA/FemB family protein [Candidatus Gottesmanbacteria bacterium]